MIKALFRRLFSYDDPDSKVNQFRSRRHGQFRDLVDSIPGSQPLRMIDLGGTPKYWRTHGVPDRIGEIVILNLAEPDETWRTAAAAIPIQVQMVCGDATTTGFDLDHFDIVFSNSVIEHVGSRAQQERFADEVRRIGKTFYVQTPSKWFPLEAHTRLPFFGYLPRRAQALAIWKFAVHYYPDAQSWSEALEATNTTILLKQRDMTSLFPGANLTTEKVIGIPKSYTVTGGFGAPLGAS